MTVMLQELCERQNFWGDIFYGTNCMVRITLDKLLNENYSSSGLRRKASKRAIECTQLEWSLMKGTEGQA